MTTTSEATFTTSARWFGPAERSLLGWWTEPFGRTSRNSRSVAVILPPIGYEYWSSHRTLRTLAESLAERGHRVLRIDYDGLGDSAGACWDGGRVRAWRRSVGLAVDEVRARGAERVTLIGLRLGATLALLEAAAARVDAVVAWVPVTSGRRFMRELRMLALPVPAAASEAEPPEAFVYAGTVFSPETAAELGRIDLEKMAERPAARVLIVARPEASCEKLAAQMVQLGAATEHKVLPGVEVTLDVPAEDATLPTGIIDAIAAGLGDASPAEAPLPTPAPRPSAEIAWGAGRLTEEVIRLGEGSLVGVLGRPSDRARSATVVFLNSGSEPHVGPGRAWVEYARELNLRGYSTLRLDFSGWGESPDRGHAPGRPYDPHCLDEAVAAVAALRKDGHQRVVLLGLCAGAWMGLRAALHTQLDGVVAINPQLYWEPGSPVEALLSDTRKRRAAERQREELGGRWGLWSALDVVGIRPYSGRWLSRLHRTGTPALLLFAEGDDGLEFLHNRVHRRLRRVTRDGVIRVVEVPAVDHQMYREWRRGEVVARIADFLNTLPDRT